MKNEIMVNHNNRFVFGDRFNKTAKPALFETNDASALPEILYITSYHPRECGIAAYSQDLIKVLNDKYHNSFKIIICPIETANENYTYHEDIKHILDIDKKNAFIKLAESINKSETVKIVLVQHEFSLFSGKDYEFQQFLNILKKPVVVVFHTVLPKPDQSLKYRVREIAKRCKSIVVMTDLSAKILVNDYEVEPEKMNVIPHGTHLITHSDRELLKEKYELKGKKILSTFGLLTSEKSIETTLEALPAIIEQNANVVFLIIGKTHPSVANHEGEKYRAVLEAKIEELNLQNYVQFVNEYVELPNLLEYLQLTDVYLFTSKDPHQAVSGTFSYAMGCGCAVISTPIPHAQEVLQDDAGVMIDFGNSEQLALAVIAILDQEELRNSISMKGLHRIVPTVWENAGIAHALLFSAMSEHEISLNYKIPEINLDHIKRLTTSFGMYQSCIINQPDNESGHTLDDNARAMVAMCQHYELTKDEEDLKYINIYYNFIEYCLQSEGYFLNYVDENRKFTEQNYQKNLADSNGRAIWALGYLISLREILPKELIDDAQLTMQAALSKVHNIHSNRAIAFIIKGLYYRNIEHKSSQDIDLINELTHRLLQMYRHESERDWDWFESYLTYGNSVIPEAMLCAYLATGEVIYKDTAKKTFDFLLTKIFTENRIKVISTKGRSNKGDNSDKIVVGGEQPIDVSYTIMALNKFYKVFKDEEYKQKMKVAFDWFLGNNHLNQIIYNPCTGGCYDGLEESYINLNQGAESTVSYLMARITIETYAKYDQQAIISPEEDFKMDNIVLK